MRCCCIETRDIVILKKIIQYCGRIESNLKRCGYSKERFCGDDMFLDACSMCVVQIGELAGQLSEEAKQKRPEIPWRVIKDTRNFYVHAYGSVDVNSVWTTLLEDIPALKAGCEEFLLSTIG